MARRPPLTDRAAASARGQCAAAAARSWSSASSARTPHAAASSTWPAPPPVHEPQRSERSSGWVRGEWGKNSGGPWPERHAVFVCSRAIFWRVRVRRLRRGGAAVATGLVRERRSDGAVVSGSPPHGATVGGVRRPKKAPATKLFVHLAETLSLLVCLYLVDPARRTTRCRHSALQSSARWCC